LPAINVAKTALIKVAIFFQLDADVFFPFGYVHCAVQFYGVGGFVMQRVVTGKGHTALHIPHTDGGAGCVAMKTNRVRVNGRRDPLGNGLLTRCF